MKLRYKARAISGGKPVRGTVEASGEREATAQLRDRGLVPEKFRPLPRWPDLNRALWVGDRALARAAGQFSVLLRAGLPLGRAVELMASQTRDRGMKNILAACAADVSAGRTLAQSLERHGRGIPTPFLETIRAGEASGALERCFARLKGYYERTHRVKRKVRAALIYPAFLLALACAVVGIVMVVLVPGMVRVFRGLGAELPLPTRVLLGLSDFFVRRWPLLLLCLGSLGLGGQLWRGTPAGSLAAGPPQASRASNAYVGDEEGDAGASGDVVGGAAGTFANTLSVLLSAGLPIPQALPILSGVLDNAAIAQTVRRAAAGVEAGERLGEVLRDSPCLPPALLEMIDLGEETGTLTETMDAIGAYFDEEAEAASARAVELLEPALTLILGLLVGFVVIAVYVPLFTMETMVGG